MSDRASLLPLIRIEEVAVEHDAWRGPLSYVSVHVVFQLRGSENSIQITRV
jgi:hypothetical protein